MFFYTYMHVDPRTEEVRYVGVGSLSRAYDFALRGRAHYQWLTELDDADLEPRVAIVTRTRDRAEALEVERALISWHRERGSELFNITAGGAGASVPISEERKRQISAVQTAKWLFDPDFRARRLPDLAKARAARNRTPEHVAKITKHEKVTGRPCAKCGGTLRYATGRNCVSCAKKP